MKKWRVRREQIYSSTRGALPTRHRSRPGDAGLHKTDKTSTLQILSRGEMGWGEAGREFLCCSRGLRFLFFSLDSEASKGQYSSTYYMADIGLGLGDSVALCIDFGVRKTRVPALLPPLPRCIVTWDSVVKLSDLQFPHLQNGPHKTPYHREAM